MDVERSIIRNCVIITTLFVPCVLIAVFTALIYVVKAFVRVVDKFCSYIQHELDSFNEIHGVSQAPVGDEGGLFLAFTKGEDVHSCRHKKNNLRPKAEKEKKAIITERIYSGIAVASTVKRPINGDILLRDLILERSCTSLRACSGITGKRTLPYVRKSHDCTRIGASKSETNHLETSDVVTDANLLRTVNGSKDHSHEITLTSPRANREDHCQAADGSSDVNLQKGESLPCSQITVLSAQNSKEK